MRPSNFLSLLFILLVLNSFFTSAIALTPSCVKIYKTKAEQKVDDQYWMKRLSERYKKNNNMWYSLTNFWDFNGRDGFPAIRESHAYEMANRFFQGDNHAQLAQKKLGYTMGQDAYGRYGMQPPKTLIQFLTHFEKWKTELNLVGENAMEMVFLFIDKSNDKPPTDWNEYVVVKASDIKTLGAWPDKSKYRNVSEMGNNAQLPNSIFLKLLSKRWIPFPSESFFDHEIAHLTEIMGQSTSPKNSYLDEIQRLAISRETTLLQNPQLKDSIDKREAVLLEFFALPDLEKSAQIADFLKSYGRTTELTLQKISNQHFNQMAHLSFAELNPIIRRLLQDISALIYRQGGGMRDSYNATPRDRIISINEDLLLENGFSPKTDGWQTEKLNDSIFRDSLPGYLIHIKLALEMLEERKQWGTDLFNLEYNRKPSIKIDEERYEIMIKRFIAFRIARIVMAFSRGLELQLTPTESIVDGLTPSFNPESKLGRYLDSYLPPNSAQREMFFGKK